MYILRIKYICKKKKEKKRRCYNSVDLKWQGNKIKIKVVAIMEHVGFSSWRSLPKATQRRLKDRRFARIQDVLSR